MKYRRRRWPTFQKPRAFGNTAGRGGLSGQTTRQRQERLRDGFVRKQRTVFLDLRAGLGAFKNRKSPQHHAAFVPAELLDHGASCSARTPAPPGQRSLSSRQRGKCSEHQCQREEGERIWIQKFKIMSQKVNTGPLSRLPRPVLSE